MEGCASRVGREHKPEAERSGPGGICTMKKRDELKMRAGQGISQTAEEKEFERQV